MSARPIQSQGSCRSTRRHKLDGRGSVATILNGYVHVPNPYRGLDFNRATPGAGLPHSLNVLGAFERKQVVCLHTVQHGFIGRQIITNDLAHAVGGDIQEATEAVKQATHVYRSERKKIDGGSL